MSVRARVRHGCRIGVVCASLVAARAGADPIAAPTASPLREIGRTGARTTCDSIRWPIAPVVLALAKNDELIAAGRRATVKMRDDATSGSRARVEFGRAVSRSSRATHAP